MMEILMSRKKKPTGSAVPLIGYNFDKDKSTGSNTVTVANTSGNLVALPVALNGYAKTLKTVTSGQHNISPFTALNAIQKGDFTLELWVYFPSASISGYQYFLYFQYNSASKNTGIPIRLSDSGYGNRLQASTDPTVAANTYGTADTKTSLAGSWHHIAVVRRKNKLSIFVDGNLRPLASGTAGVGSDTALVSNESISGMTAASIGFTTYSPTSVYIPEFAFWDYAKYSTKFSPAAPLL